MDQSTTASVSHTAGPWHAEEAPSASSMRSIRTASGKAIAFVNRGPDAAANEQLIIAAPDLYHALQEFIDDEPCRLDHEGYCQSHYLTNPCIMVEAKNAIRKAEGLA